jgi:hypothetical protein
MNQLNEAYEQSIDTVCDAMFWSTLGINFMIILFLAVPKGY